MFSPIVRSTWLNLQLPVMFTNVVTGSCKYNQVLLMMGENISRNT
jgi:hypothetical protein